VPEHAVIVNVPLRGASGDFELVDELGERLREHLEGSGVGEFDGNMIGRDLGVLYLYGADADRLWQEVAPLVREAALPAGAYALKRGGPPGSAEIRVDF
jgi:hypothetical protein